MLTAEKPSQHPETAPNSPGWPADSVEHRLISGLVPYARNARTHSQAQIAQLAASMVEFGWTNPVLVDEHGGIIAGHGRVLAAQKLADAGRPEFLIGRVMTARGWTEAQKRAYVIADNKLALNAGWDDELLALELADLKVLDPASLGLIGFTDDELADLLADPDAEDGPYSRKIEAPIYQPTGENPPVASLIDDAKTQELKGAIRSAELPDDVAAFLERAAERHTVFNFARIAEFYAHAPTEIQSLMEASALVIIDFDQAIEGGFVKLTKRLSELVPDQAGHSPVEGSDAAG